MQKKTMAYLHLLSIVMYAILPTYAVRALRSPSALYFKSIKRDNTMSVYQFQEKKNDSAPDKHLSEN